MGLDLLYIPTLRDGELSFMTAYGAEITKTSTRGLTNRRGRGREEPTREREK